MADWRDDFELASNYTDDTLAQQAASTATTAASEASAAKSDAASAKTTATTAASTASAADTKATTAASDAATAKTTANSAASTASTAKTTADNAASTAATAKITADAAKTTATTAKTTANTAKTTADTAKSTADAAKTTATEAKETAEATANYFMVDDDGAYVASVEGNHDSGKNLKLSTDGLTLRNNTADIASFKSDRVSLASECLVIDVGATGGVRLEAINQTLNNGGIGLQVDPQFDFVASGGVTIEGGESYIVLNDGMTIQKENVGNVASFGDAKIELGQESASIDMADGLLTFGAKTVGDEKWGEIRCSDQLSLMVPYGRAVHLGMYTQDGSAPSDWGIGLSGDGNVMVNSNEFIANGYGVTPTILFDNDNASMTGATHLSESAANFQRLTICYRSTDNVFSSVDVFSPNGKKVSLSITHSNTNANLAFNKTKVVLIQGTRIDTAQSSNGSYITGEWASTGTVTGGDFIGITQVLGWRIV